MTRFPDIIGKTHDQIHLTGTMEFGHAQKPMTTGMPTVHPTGTVDSRPNGHGNP